MTGYWDCDFLVNGKYYANVSESSNTKEIDGASYQSGDFKKIKSPKNNTKLEVNIEYFED